VVTSASGRRPRLWPGACRQVDPTTLACAGPGSAQCVRRRRAVGAVRLRGSGQPGVVPPRAWTRVGSTITQATTPHSPSRHSGDLPEHAHVQVIVNLCSPGLTLKEIETVAVVHPRVTPWRSGDRSARRCAPGLVVAGRPRRVRRRRATVAKRSCIAHVRRWSARWESRGSA